MTVNNALENMCGRRQAWLHLVAVPQNMREGRHGFIWCNATKKALYDSAPDKICTSHLLNMKTDRQTHRQTVLFVMSFHNRRNSQIYSQSRKPKTNTATELSFSPLLNGCYGASTHSQLQAFRDLMPC